MGVDRNAVLRLRPPRDVGPVLLGNQIGLRGGAAYWHSARSRAYLELELQSSLRQLSQQSFPIEWRAGATLCMTSALALDVAGAPASTTASGRLRSARLGRPLRPPALQASKRQGPEPGLEELSRRSPRSVPRARTPSLRRACRGCSPNRSWPRGRPSCDGGPRSPRGLRTDALGRARRSPRRTRATRTGTACRQAGQLPAGEGAGGQPRVSARAQADRDHCARTGSTCSTRSTFRRARPGSKRDPSGSWTRSRASASPTRRLVRVQSRTHGRSRRGSLNLALSQARARR